MNCVLVYIRARITFVVVGLRKMTRSSSPYIHAIYSLKFDNFAVDASTTVPGLLTVTAQPTNVTAMAMAKVRVCMYVYMYV